jgi:hypothetical protein
MNLNLAMTRGVEFLKTNSPQLFAGAAIVGLGATVVLSVRAGSKYALDVQSDTQEGRVLETRQELLTRRAKTHWRTFVPPAAAGVITAGCIVASNRAAGAQTAAALAAYSLSDRAFGDYKKKVVEELGEKKEQAVRDAVAQERVAKGPDAGLVMIGDGKVLCCELYTGRYFMCDAQTLTNAQNKMNAQAINGFEAKVVLDDFYHEIGLPYTSQSGVMGWTSDRLLQLEFSSVLTPDDKPCLAFDYNYVSPIWAIDRCP